MSFVARNSVAVDGAGQAGTRGARRARVVRRPSRRRTGDVLVAVHDVGAEQQGVAGRLVEPLRHVAAEEPGGRRHDVVERGVEQQLADRHGVALLGHRDLVLAGGERSGLHPHALRQLRGVAEVVVPHEVDGEAGLHAQLRLLHGELLEAQDRHRLEQDLLAPEGLDGLGQLRVGPGVAGGRTAECPRAGDGGCHGVSSSRTSDGPARCRAPSRRLVGWHSGAGPVDASRSQTCSCQRSRRR
jgi:hypothetical protein